jgi:hypothetical protein
MAERIVSPGVFTEEKDLSFLPQGIANIGAAFVGPTIKGPAFIPTQVGSYGDFVQIFGDTNPNFYLPYTAKEYLNNTSNLTVVRVLHDDGFQVNAPVAIVSSGSFGRKHIGTLFPSQVVADINPSNSDEKFSIGTLEEIFERTTLASNISGSVVIKLSGSYTTTNSVAAGATGSFYSASLSSTSANYLPRVFSNASTVSTNAAYLYTFFAQAASASLAADPNCRIEIQTGSYVAESTYSEATTPYIISQTVNATNYNLFKFHTIADGNNSNFEIKVAISDIKAAGTVPGSSFGSFTVTIRAVDQTYLAAIGSPFSYRDSDNRPNILESFDNCNLDPNSSRYVARVIGDRFRTFASGGQVVVNGNYANKSKYVYIEMDPDVDAGAISNQLVPFGFAELFNPLPSAFTNVSPASFVANQQIGGIYNRRKFYGFDFDFGTTDNINYLKSLPATTTTGSNAKFLLSNFNQEAGANYPSATNPYSGPIDLTTNTKIDTRKFIVPFQGGFDGAQPFKPVLVGSSISSANTQGFDLNGSSGKDYSVYKDALDILSNVDEIDINMLTLPGVIQTLHSAVIDYAYNMCEDRGDTFMIFDCVGLTANVDTAVDAVEAIDSNYAATYYPWVRIVDANINKPVWVPPSVVLPGVLAYNDRVAAEWYAPAGLNRGGLTTVLDAYVRLTNAQRDTLYEGRVNPIATFPSVGVCVWGQKTLQAKPSALDRINVRRLLIALKKYIASATKYLVFEQNTAATRNRFLNIVNPYLESVQQRQGLYAFKVVMDDTNNTPDLIDRNIMYGQIFLQPTKTAEFIIIDFNILPTGAAFPGA